MYTDEMVDKIINMTNKEAADILRASMVWLSIARGNGKTARLIQYNVAMNKAIQILENTPDEDA